jgi:ribosomal protein S18 acetylase RimI-like enzyme
VTCSVRALTADEIAGPQLEALLRVFAAAMGYGVASHSVVSQGSATRRHSARGGFRAFGAFDAQDRVVGFSYGYHSQPGLWWREQVSASLTPSQRAEWLADAFEVCELHVHPAFQGQHLGSGLHDALVAGLPQKTALLSVMHRSERARQLYASRGWQALIEDLRFSSDPLTAFSILGLAL